MTQTELPAIYATLTHALKTHVPPLVVKFDGPSKYDVWSERQVVIAGRPPGGLCFAMVIMQRSYVGFHLMAATSPLFRNTLKPELLETLKGKSCFHIAKLDDALLEQITEAIETGLRAYKKNGWV
jgi:hypothetical protein